MAKRDRGGSYILVIHLPGETRLSTGRLGEIIFRPGYYAYVGSAMRGFGSRLPHHLRKNPKPHWHIDYLLQTASVERIMTFESDTRQECAIAGFLMQQLEYIPGFGCSDCKCKSHLFYAIKADRLQKSTRALAKKYITGLSFVCTPVKAGV
jgi:Uri superfamily endonuclease